MTAFLLLPLLALVPAISAAPLPHHLAKRIQPPGDLFGPTGKPDFWDVAQTTIPNCGWAATMASIAHVNPDFLSAIITDNGDGESATFDIWDYPSYEKNPQVVFKRDLPDNAANKGPVWWPGGIEHAAVQAGKEMPGVSAGDSLAIMTGIKHESPASTMFAPSYGMNEEEMWELLKHAVDSPMILDAMGGDTIVGNHAHAVLNTTEVNGERRIALYNPWGGDDVFNYHDVFKQIIFIHHLKNFETGPIDNGSNKPAPTDKPAPAPAPAPIPTENAGPSGAADKKEEEAATSAETRATPQPTSQPTKDETAPVPASTESTSQPEPTMTARPTADAEKDANTAEPSPASNAPRPEPTASNTDDETDSDAEESGARYPDWKGGRGGRWRQNAASMGSEQAEVKGGAVDKPKKEGGKCTRRTRR